MKPPATGRFLLRWPTFFASAVLCTFDAAAQSSSDHLPPAAMSPADARVPQARLLTEARTYLDLESFDLADKRYRQVLALDPENKTATLGRSEVRDARARFEKEVAESRRSRTSAVKIPAEQNALDTATVARKLQSITIPLFEVSDMTLNDVLERLRQDALKYDADPVEEERGLNIFLKLPQPLKPDVGIPGLTPPRTPEVVPDESASPASKKITLRLTNVSLLQALNQTAQSVGLKIKIEPYAVSLVPFVESTEDLATLEIRVPQAFLGIDTGSPATKLPSATADRTGGSGPLAVRTDAKTFLESCGVTFPPGSAAVYLQSTQKLVVRNTHANLELVELLCDEFKKSTKTVDNP